MGRVYADVQQVLELSNDFEAIGLKILAEVHPWTKVVNSVIVFKAI